MQRLLSATPFPRFARMVILSHVILLACCLLPASAADEAWLDAAAAGFSLRGAADSYLLASTSPRPDLSLHCSFSFTSPGTVLDTVGINAAPDGAWTLRLEAGGSLVFALYAARGGKADWTRVTLASGLVAGREYKLVLSIASGLLDGAVYEQDRLLNGLNARLPGYPLDAPVYVGDFPGDNGWGADYDIYRAFSGQLKVLYFGRRIDALSPQTIKGSIVIKQPGATENPLGKTAPVKPLELRVADVPAAQTPADAVRLLLEAQTRGDVPSVLGYTDLERSSKEAQLTAQSLLLLVASKLKTSDLSFTALATSYGKQGNFALVRCRHGVFIAGGKDASREEFGSLVLVRKTGAGWKVLEFMPDYLLNTVIADEKPGGAIQSMQAGFMLPAPPRSYAAASPAQGAAAAASTKSPGLIDYQAVNEQFQETMNTERFDEAKIHYDETFSLAGWIPFFGDAVSSTYTGLQTGKTFFTEFLPDLWHGDWELVGYDATQVAVGVLQILAEPTMGLDVLVDNLGIKLDNWKYNVVQGRNYSRIRLALMYSNLEGMKKYLFLRPQPIHTDPQYGAVTATQVNLRIEYYDEWGGEIKPVKKLIFLSDIPLRFWKSLDFDIGFELVIKRSESEDLYDAAIALGVQGHAQAGVIAEHTVAIPVRLGTSARDRLVAGELDMRTLSNNPRQEATPQLTEQGMPILRNARIMTGQAGDRFIRMDITPTAGPDQTIRVNLLTATDDMTEPLVIENAVYNDLAGVTPIDLEGFKIASKDPELLVAVGQTVEYMPLGETPIHPKPRIVGAPVSDWVIDAPLVAGLEIVGQFPDAKLQLTGKTPGLTYLRYTLQSGDQTAQKAIDGVLMVRVEAAGYKLVDVKIAETSNPGNTGFSVRDGQAQGSMPEGDVGGQPQCITIGSATWNPPPSVLLGADPVWNLSYDVSVNYTLGGPPAGQYSTSEVRLEHPTSSQKSRSFKTSPREGGSLAGSESIPLGAFIIDESENTAPYKLTGRKLLNLYVCCPGGSATVTYVYAPIK